MVKEEGKPVECIVMVYLGGKKIRGRGVGPTEEAALQAAWADVQAVIRETAK